MQRRPWLLQKPLMMEMPTRSSSRAMVSSICSDFQSCAIGRPRILRSFSESMMRTAIFSWTAGGH
ncbi:unnamed protein product [Heligmosomoides polygyrus]|uniref:Uncharacterized protein n=1 Tax=Heligmosomoides polygyrus TaxID=6339 RepID=A0A3P8FH24_HELPZ|nr:unnamed protein product [Heligmosomoides polygyrus]